MYLRQMTENELTLAKGGEAITLTAVMAIAAIAIVAVVVFKLFTSSKGTTTIPGGWKFSWN